MGREKWIYLSHLIVGGIALLLFGPMQCALLRQDEGLGMAVAFGPMMLLGIPFVAAFAGALVLCLVGVVRGPGVVRARLALWYGAAAVFVIQIVRLDPLTGHGPLPAATVRLFGVLGFAPLLAVFLLPVWWLRQHRSSPPRSLTSA